MGPRTVLLAASLAVALEAHAAPDRSFYRYDDEHGDEVIVQGLEQVPPERRGAATEIVVGPHYGGKAKPKPPPPPPVLTAPDGTPCAPTSAMSWWRKLVPADPLRRWLFVGAFAVSLLVSIWLFRVIKFTVWLRALITMSPFVPVIVLLWIVTDRMAASQAKRAGIACGPAPKPDVLDKLLEGHTKHLDTMDKAIEHETTGK